MASAVEEGRATGWPRRGYAWYVVVVLAVAYAFAVLDRVAISLLVDPIKADLHITDTQVGLLQGLAFAICYTSFGLVFGFFVDRLNRRRLLSLGVFIWSLATLACGFTMTFGSLFLARIGVGVGEASVTPASSSLIADYFPPAQRPRAYSVFLLGSSVGTGLSYLVGGLAIVLAAWLRTHAGAPWSTFHTWQIAFFLVGAPGVLVALLVYFTVKEPARRGHLVVAAGAGNWSATFALLRGEWKAYATLILGIVLTVVGVYASIGWNAASFIRERHWSPPRTAAVFAFYTVPLGMVGALIGGWIMAWMLKRGRNDAPIWLALAAALATMISGPAMALTDNTTVALALYAPYALTSTWAYTAALTGINNITPNELRGQVTSLYTLLTGLVSMTVGTAAVGMFSDHVFHYPGGLRVSLAAVFAIAGALSAVVLLVGRGAFRRVADRARVWEEAA